MVSQRDGQYWWLSFVDREGGRGWMGATIIPAKDGIDAVREARRVGANPGGEVMMVPIPQGAFIPDALVWHLVEDADELAALYGNDGKLVRVCAECAGKCVCCEAEGQRGITR